MYRFRDIAGYLSKVADFDPPHLHSDTDTDGHRPMAGTADAQHRAVKTRANIKLKHGGPDASNPVGSRR